MVITRNTDPNYLHQMAERMGSQTVQSEAEAMVEALIARGYQFTDTADVPADIWTECLEAAAA